MQRGSVSSHPQYIISFQFNKYYDLSPEYISDFDLRMFQVLLSEDTSAGVGPHNTVSSHVFIEGISFHHDECSECLLHNVCPHTGVPFTTGVTVQSVSSSEYHYRHG